MALSEEWKEKIREKLCRIFEGEPNTLIDALLSLNSNDCEQTNWETLKSLFDEDKVFKVLAKQIADAKACQRVAEEEGNRKLQQAIREDTREIIRRCTEIRMKQQFQLIEGPNSIEQEFAVAEYNAEKCVAESRNFEFREKFQHSSKFKCSFSTVIAPIISSIDDLVIHFGKNILIGNIAMAGLAALYLGIDTILNIRNYWIGEITGKRCCKNIVDTTVTVNASIWGSIIGAMAGSLLGPCGTVLGGIAGGIITSIGASILSGMLTRYLFGIPKDKALEKAYSYFGVNMNTKDTELYSAYRRMCLQHHPDKGGSEEEFLTVQLHMSIIKIAKENL